MRTDCKRGAESVISTIFKISRRPRKVVSVAAFAAMSLLRLALESICHLTQPSVMVVFIRDKLNPLRLREFSSLGKSFLVLIASIDV